MQGAQEVMASWPAEAVSTEARQSTAVLAALSFWDYAFVANVPGNDAYKATGRCISVAAGRISYTYGFKGGYSFVLYIQTQKQLPDYTDKGLGSTQLKFSQPFGLVSAKSYDLGSSRGVLSIELLSNPRICRVSNEKSTSLLLQHCASLQLQTYHSNKPDMDAWLAGPAISIDTACSSTLTAAALAASLLQQCKCSQGLIGAALLTLDPATLSMLTAASMLSPDARCKTLDASADGCMNSLTTCIFV